MQDYTEYHFEMNKKTAIKQDVETKLENILRLLTKTKLQAFAAQHQIAGRSKMGKDELAAALVPAISDAQYLLDTLVIMGEREWMLFDEVMNSKQPLVYDGAPIGFYSYLQDAGIIHLFYYEDHIYLVIADEIRDTWESLNKQTVRKEKRQYQLVHNYIAAFSNLYGAFKPEQLVEVFNKQQAAQLTEEELMQYVNKFLQKQQIFTWQPPYIASSYFDDEKTSNELADLLLKRSGKPFYEPEAKELLKYADSGYYEVTSQLQTLYDYVGAYLCKDKDFLEMLIDDIQLACSMESSMSDIMDEFVRRDIVFESAEQVHLVSSIINEVYNNTRLWSNAGHTPYELKNMFEQNESKQAVAAVSSSTAKAKVGRNEPCTCGSGKKYKKCCGA
ncbi:YecA family protein [Paenibacillus sp. GXUN7292]|uniref:YecA family protein n=1 Tax=Paenibacillus sp. GXUN7292 TaxID=3422499 RepID=UPI003D7EADE1